MSDPTRCVFCGHLPDTCDCSQNEYNNNYYNEKNDFFGDDDYEDGEDDSEW